MTLFGVTPWRKPSPCQTGECIEVARRPGGQVAVRDSKDPDGPVVTYTADAWRHFARALRAENNSGWFPRICGLTTR